MRAPTFDPADVPPLRPNEVHVVDLCLDRGVADHVDCLDAQERERATRFVFERDRRRFVEAHVSVRLTLAAYLHRAPGSLRFTKDDRGKPRLVDPPANVRFNVSHAGERALLALALGQEVGADIEVERPIEVLQLADRFFAPSEVAAIRSLPTAQRTAAFYRCWTRKEAFIKALGAGLSFPLDGFEVRVDDDNDSDQLLRGCAAAPGELLRWRVRSLAIPSPFWAAVAGGPCEWRVVRWAFNRPHGR